MALNIVYAEILMSKKNSKLVSCIALTVSLLSINYSCAENGKSDWQKYGGVLVGGSYGNVKEGAGYWVAPDYDDCYVLGSTKARPKAVNANLKFGINKKINDNLVGFELGAALQNFNAKTAVGPAYSIVIGTGDGTHVPAIARTKIKTYQTLSARLGHIFKEKTLFYVSGGGATGQIQKTLTQLNNDSWFDIGVTTKDKVTRLGYTVGMGMEHSLNDKLSLRLNYEYVDFGKVKFTHQGSYGPTISTLSSVSKIDFSNISVGLSYKF